MEMTSAKLWLCVSLCFTCLHGADGYPYYWVYKCVFNSSELQDIQYIESDYFHKQEFMRFDSRVGQFVGYTEWGVKQAEYRNKDASYMAVKRAQRAGYCKHNIGNWYPSVLDKRVKPSVTLSSETPPGGRQTSMLVCSAYDFYPKQILVEWLRDGVEITSGVSYTDPIPDGDWYYQIHSYLEYTPRSGEQITCMVNHPSLTENIFVHWDDSMPEPDRNRIAIGASCLVLGLVLSLSGFIYYQWRKRGRVLVPTTTN